MHHGKGNVSRRNGLSPFQTYQIIDAASHEQFKLPNSTTQAPYKYFPILLQDLAQINNNNNNTCSNKNDEKSISGGATVIVKPNISMTSNEIFSCMKLAGLSGQKQWSCRLLPRSDPIPRPAPKPYPPVLSSQDMKYYEQNYDLSTVWPSITSAATTNSNNNTKVNLYQTQTFPHLKHHPLFPPTPVLHLKSKNEMFDPLARQFCLSLPTVVIHNVCEALQLDMSMFSSKQLAAANPSHPIEIRRQTCQSTLENRDSSGQQVWYCESSAVRSSIKEYAEYQAKCFIQNKKKAQSGGGRLSNENSKSQKQLRFGTNCDLSDYSKWGPLIDELSKLPPFLRVNGPETLLSYVGYDILGMNTVQLYMKVPGCRTPGHQENLNFCSVNINTGPGDCEWFCVSEQYWGEIYRLCHANKVDYFKGSWWPSIDDLFHQQIPVYRFVQHPGDMVWINTGTVHWVQSVGFCNNVAWNVGPMTGEQYESALERYEFNKWDQFKSIVPMIGLTWNVARNVKTTDRKLYELLRHTMMQCLVRYKQTEDLLSQLNVLVKWHGHESGDLANYCDTCDEEIFGHVFTRLEEDALYHPYCLPCAIKIDRQLRNFVALAEFSLADLQGTYDSFRLYKE